MISRVEDVRDRSDADDAFLDLKGCGAKCQNMSCSGLVLAENLRASLDLSGAVIGMLSQMWSNRAIVQALRASFHIFSLPFF
jgi:hypothetical protein